MDKMRRFVFVLVLVIVGFVCIISPALTGYDAINKRASGLIESALAENAKVFILVSGLKAGLAIIEGSTAGAVLIEVEIGDLVQPSYDFVDYIWTFLLYGLLILSIYEFILEFGLLSFGIRIMGIGFLAWGMGLLFSGARKNNNLRERTLLLMRNGLPLLARIFISIGLLLAYLVPVTLIASYSIRGFITEPVKIRKTEEIRELKQGLDQLREEFLSIKEDLSVTHPMESANRVKTRMRTIATSLFNAFNDSLHIFLYYVVVIFIEVLLFPVLTAIVLYKFGQFAIEKVSPRIIASGNPGLSTVSQADGNTIGASPPPTP